MKAKQNANVGSNWNQVGTWEEKHFTIDALKEHLGTQNITFEGGYRVSKISNVEGDVSCVMVRGKKKVGFTLKMDIEVEKGTQFITIKFEEFNEYMDHEVNISPEIYSALV